MKITLATMILTLLVLSLSAENGYLLAWGINSQGQCSVPPFNYCTGIAAGKVHNVALKSNGILVAGVDN